MPRSEILNREAGYGAASPFILRHQDPDSLNAGLRFILLLAWLLSERGGVLSHEAHLHPGVKRALVLLAEPDFEGGLAELARRCGVSTTCLSRLFAREVGIPLSKYRNSVRLGRFLSHYQAAPRHGLLGAAPAT
jgi:hypothetical protein